MKLDDERKNLLTEYLGECWHKPSDDDYMICRHCGITFQGSWRDDGGFRHMEAIIEQRTFTFDSDMMALFRKLVDDSHHWYDFCDWARWKHTHFSQEDYDEIAAWLFYDPERFCNLVAEWLEVK